MGRFVSADRSVKSERRRRRSSISVAFHRQAPSRNGLIGRSFPRIHYIKAAATTLTNRAIFTPVAKLPNCEFCQGGGGGREEGRSGDLAKKWGINIMGIDHYFTLGPRGGGGQIIEEVVNEREAD